MKIDKKWKEKRWGAYTIAACSAVLFYVILTHLGVIAGGIGRFFHILSPIFFGIFFAYIIDALVRLLNRTLFSRVRSARASRILSIIVAVLLVLGLLAILVVSLVPQLIRSITTLVGNLDSYANSFHDWLLHLDHRLSGNRPDFSGFSDIGANIMERVSSLLPKVLDWLVGASMTIGKQFVSTVISFVLAVYFLLDKERILSALTKLLHILFVGKRRAIVSNFLSRCNEILIRYIVCTLLDALIVGFANLIFMRIANLPYAVLVSVVVAVTNLAPTFGPIVGGVIGAFILILVNPWYALWFVIFTLILQTIDGYILKPRLFGNSFGVSALFILISIIVFGRIFGVFGVVFAIPLAAIIDFIFRSYFWPWIQTRRKKHSKEELTTDAKEGP